MHQLITYACFYTPVIHIHNYTTPWFVCIRHFYTITYFYTQNAVTYANSFTCIILLFANTFPYILHLYTLDPFAHTFAWRNSLGSFLLEMRVLRLFAAHTASVGWTQVLGTLVRIITSTACESVSGLLVISPASLIPTDSCLAAGLSRGFPNPLQFSLLLWRLCRTVSVSLGNCPSPFLFIFFA